MAAVSHRKPLRQVGIDDQEAEAHVPSERADTSG
jgi:hypothetical protein